MRISRTGVGAVLLVVETGIGVLGVLFHYGLTVEYGNVTDATLGGFVSALADGIGGIALVIVAIPGLIAFLVSPHLRMRLAAVTVPVLMGLAMFVVTPAALREKLDVQYDATPQCVSQEDTRPGPGTRAARESQEAFESIAHVGHFNGGGGSGVGGCDRPLVLTEDVDVLQHYRGALADAGWRVVEDDENHLRAERGGMAFEVAVCDRGGVVWAGSTGVGGGARCEQSDEVSVSVH